MTQYISVPKILKALNTLKIMGNPYYQFIPVSEHFEDECKENDLEGFQFIYPEDEIMEEKIDDRSNEVEVTEETEGTKETKEAKDTEDTEAILEKEEEDYQLVSAMIIQKLATKRIVGIDFQLLQVKASIQVTFFKKGTGT
jgi:hypothetical protein